MVINIKCVLFHMVSMALLSWGTLVLARDATYPQIWPERLHTNSMKCASIDGRYAYYGDQFPVVKNSTTPQLGIGIVFNGLFISGNPRYAEILLDEVALKASVKIAGNSLSIISEQRQRYIYVSDQLLIFEQQFECDDGVLRFMFKYDSGSEGMVHKGFDTYEFFKVEDGGLAVNVKYVKDSSSFLGVAGYKRSEGNYWYRFLPAK